MDGGASTTRAGRVRAMRILLPAMLQPVFCPKRSQTSTSDLFTRMFAARSSLVVSWGGLCGR